MSFSFTQTGFATLSYDHTLCEKHFPKQLVKINCMFDSSDPHLGVAP